MKAMITLGITAALAIGLVSAAAAISPSCGDTTGPGSTDVPCNCGDTVTTDTTLTNLDPVVTAPCPSRGLTVAGVHLNLGGKTIAGSGNENGLFLTGAGGSVSNGRITGFATGITSGFASSISGWEIVRQTPVVAGGLRVTGNATGILLVADDTKITDVAATGNGAGVVVFGLRNSVVRITCSSNRGPAGADGLSIVGDGNSLEHNRCEKNGRDGIAVLGANNILIRNQATANGRQGVVAVGDGNDFFTNRATNNGGDGVIGDGFGLSTDGRNYGTGNRGGTNCQIDGFSPSPGGRYC